MAALGSHKAYTHKVGGKAETTEIENEPEIVDLKTQVRKTELSSRLQRLKASINGGGGNLLFRELDRMGRELDFLKKDNEKLRATIPDPGMIAHLFSAVGDLTSQVIELNKIVGQSLVMEGWGLPTDMNGVYNFRGFGDHRLQFLVKEGRLKVKLPLAP